VRKSEQAHHPATMQEAKARVYKVVQPPPKRGTAAASKPHLSPVLQEMPKWPVLRQLAEEIQVQRSLLASLADAQPHDRPSAGHDNEDVDMAVDEEAEAAEDPHAWIRELSAAQAAACGDAAVLVIAKEPHLLPELRAVLQARGQLQHPTPRRAVLARLP
jgi:hypothetical protein